MAEAEGTGPHSAPEPQEGYPMEGGYEPPPPPPPPPGEPEPSATLPEPVTAEPEQPGQQEQPAGAGPGPESTGLLGIRIPVSRAVIAALLLVAVTDISVGVAVFVLDRIPSVGPVVRGIVLATLIVVGYAAGLAVAIGMTRKPQVTIGRSYSLRHLTAAAALLAVVVALGVRVLGAVLEEIVLSGFKVQLPGMNVDPTSIFGQGPLGIVVTFVLFAGLAPFAEELAFRGILMGSLSQHMRFWWANLIAATVFAALHFNPFAAGPVFIAALGFGWLFRRTGTLWAPIVAHAAFNATGLALAYALQGRGGM